MDNKNTEREKVMKNSKTALTRTQQFNCGNKNPNSLITIKTIIKSATLKP